MYRKTPIYLALPMTLFAGCQNYDKAAHFAVGAAVSHAVVSQTDNKMAGCLAALGAGLAKEMIDDYADPLDLIATGLGCSITLAR